MKTLVNIFQTILLLILSINPSFAQEKDGEPQEPTYSYRSPGFSPIADGNHNFPLTHQQNWFLLRQNLIDTQFTFFQDIMKQQMEMMTSFMKYSVEQNRLMMGLSNNSYVTKETNPMTKFDPEREAGKSTNEIIDIEEIKEEQAGTVAI